MIINSAEFLSIYTSEKWNGGQFLDFPTLYRLRITEEPFMELPDEYILKLEHKRRKILQREEISEKIRRLRNKGRIAEEEENSSDAMGYYTQAILLAESSGLDIFHAIRYCYDRTIDLCREQQLQDLEEILLKSLLHHSLSDDDRKYYSNRLNQISV